MEESQGSRPTQTRQRSENPEKLPAISLLCTIYKLLERIVLIRLQPVVEEKLIPQQAGFQPGKSCCSQVLNLTQHIEDGFQQGKITGAALIDLSAAYDNVNHRLLLNKLYVLTEDPTLTKFIRTLKSNRRFYVELNGKQKQMVQSTEWPTTGLRSSADPFQYLYK